MRQLISVSIALALTATPAVLHSQQPRVFLLNAKLLTEIEALPPTDPAKQNIVSLATADADRALHEGPFTVTSKEVTPPSGDKHDYMSQAPYFWPDPSKSDGKPYIRKDGQRNPEIRKITDHDALGRLGEASRALALGYFLTGSRSMQTALLYSSEHGFLLLLHA